MPSIYRTRGSKRPKGSGPAGAGRRTSAGRADRVPAGWPPGDRAKAPKPARAASTAKAPKPARAAPSAGAPKARAGRPLPETRRPAGEATQSRTARRRAARRRRDRLLLAVSVVVSLLIVAAWFPASALLHQRHQLASTAARLHHVRAEDAALRQEEQRLGDPSEVARIAREQYQLVHPGQQSYEVLPPSDSAGGTYNGDPGLQGPVVPSGASELPPGTLGSSATGQGTGGTKAAGGGTSHTGSGTGSPSRSSGTAAPTSFVGRIAQTLEFWR